MKTIVLVLTLLLSHSLGQQSAQPESGKPCRGNESDSADCITAPHATYSPDPEYPTLGHDRRLGGTVTLQLVVGADGLPHDINVKVSLFPEFDAAAVAAVKKWKFSPATRNGKPVSVTLVIGVTFHPVPRPRG